MVLLPLIILLGGYAITVWGINECWKSHNATKIPKIPQSSQDYYFDDIL